MQRSEELQFPRPRNGLCTAPKHAQQSWHMSMAFPFVHANVASHPDLRWCSVNFYTCQSYLKQMKQQQARNCLVPSVFYGTVALFKPDTIHLSNEHQPPTFTL